MTIPKIDHYEALRPDSIQALKLDGVDVLAFSLRPGDVQPWDAGNIGPNGHPNERAEVSYAAAPSSQKGASKYDVREGMLQTYKLTYRFPVGFPPHSAANHEWAMITQFHVQDEGHAPGAVGGFSGVSVHDGQITLGTPDRDGEYIFTEPIVPDAWYHRWLVVKWSATDGYVKWVDSDSKKVLGHWEGQTISAGEFKYIKQGYYRAGELPASLVYQAQVDIEDGDLTAVEVPPAPPTNAEERRLLLVDLNTKGFPELLAQADAAKAAVELMWKRVQDVLDKGP